MLVLLRNIISVLSFDKVEEIAADGVNNITGNRIMDMTILNSVVSCLACPECFAIDKLILEDLCTKKKGLASYLCIKCGACGYSRHFYSSKMIEADGCGMKPFDINTRAVYGTRAVGGGYNSLKKLCGHLNMPKCQKRVIKIFQRKSTKFVAEASRKSAASELANKNGGVSEVSVSVDGTLAETRLFFLKWCRCCNIHSQGKVVNCEIMARYCKACKSNEHLRTTDPQAYATWQATHKCSLNFYGSAPKMESTGAKRIFERSIATNNLRYMNFYWDGDSKSFKTVEYICMVIMNQ